jgi:hypothetical protein
MGQKTALHLLVVGAEVVHTRHELAHECAHETGLRAGRERIGVHLRRVELLPQPARRLERPPIGRLRLQERGQLLDCGAACGVQRWLGAQNGPGGRRLQLGEERQRRWIRGLEAGRELLEQARLPWYEPVLVMREDLQLLHEQARGRSSALVGADRPNHCAPSWPTGTHQAQRSWRPPARAAAPASGDAPGRPGNLPPRAPE